VPGIPVTSIFANMLTVIPRKQTLHNAAKAYSVKNIDKWQHWRILLTVQGVSIFAEASAIRRIKSLSTSVRPIHVHKGVAEIREAESFSQSRQGLYFEYQSTDTVDRHKASNALEHVYISVAAVPAVQRR
jgi:hypothetical protein